MYISPIVLYIPLNFPFKKRTPMTHAIILSAGQGKRMLPLTKTLPKCLLPVGDRTILEWQVRALLGAGVARLHVITGFNAARVEQCLAERFAASLPRINLVFNPFYRVSDNLASCWMARHAMGEDFILLNGDTLFEPALLNAMLASPPAPITVAIDRKERYDDDDMRVELRGSLVRAVSKTLPEERTHAESIGLLYFRENGPALFREHLNRQISRDDGLKRWFLSVVDDLAKQGLARSCDINGQRWREIDTKEDLAEAAALAPAWEGRPPQEEARIFSANARSAGVSTSMPA